MGVGGTVHEFSADLIQILLEDQGEVLAYFPENPHV